MGTSGVNVYYYRGIMIDYDGVYGDEWIGKEEDELICICLNVNRLRKDMWKEKNDSLCNFLYQMNSDIIGL